MLSALFGLALALEGQFSLNKRDPPLLPIRITYDIQNPSHSLSILRSRTALLRTVTGITTFFSNLVRVTPRIKPIPIGPVEVFGRRYPIPEGNATESDLHVTFMYDGSEEASRKRMLEPVVVKRESTGRPIHALFIMNSQFGDKIAHD